MIRCIVIQNLSAFIVVDTRNIPDNKPLKT